MQAALGVLSIGTITSLVNSVSTLSMNVYGLAGSLKISKNILHSEIIDLLIRTDLESTIKLLESIITEIPYFYNSSMSILIALKNVQEIVINIEAALKSIHDKTNYNKSIYVLKNWRSYTFADELKNLDILISVLEKRRDNLFKTLEVFKHCERKKNLENTKLLLHYDQSVKNNDDAIIVNEY